MADPLKMSHLLGCKCTVIRHGRAGRCISINTEMDQDERRKEKEWGNLAEAEVDTL